MIRLLALIPSQCEMPALSIKEKSTDLSQNKQLQAHVHNQVSSLHWGWSGLTLLVTTWASSSLP